MKHQGESIRMDHTTRTQPAAGRPLISDREPTTIWNPLFINVLLVNMTMNFGQFMMSTLIGPMASYLGATSAMVGTIVSAFSITCLLVKPVSGTIIDTYPKKKILVSAILVTMLAFVTYSLAATPMMVFAARLIHGIGMGFTTSTCLALASETLPAQKLTQGIGYYSLAQTLATAVGPSIGLSMVNHWGYSNAFRVGAAVMGLAALLAATMRTRPHTVAPAKFRFSLDRMIAKEALIPAAFLFFLALSSGATSSFLVLYARDTRGVENIGLYYTVNAVCLMATRPLIGRLGDKYGIHKVLLPAFCVYGVSLFVTSFAASLPAFLLVAVLNSLGYGAASPIIQALCMKSVPKEKRGLASTTSYIGTDVGYLVGSPVAGAIADQLGYSRMFQMMVIPILCAVLLFVLSYRQIKQVGTSA